MKAKKVKRLFEQLLKTTPPEPGTWRIYPNGLCEATYKFGDNTLYVTFDEDFEIIRYEFPQEGIVITK
jgi:hypothetical protein